MAEVKKSAGLGGRPEMNTTLDEAVEMIKDRPDIRAELRPVQVDHAERARLRTEALFEHLGDVEAGLNEFYIPPEIIPDGWTYEWKRWSVINEVDKHYQILLRRTGWDYVPASRHPEYTVLGGADEFIFLKGMVLMERPKEVTDRFKRLDYENARDAVRRKEAQISGAGGPDQFERDNKGEKLVKIRKGWGPVKIPD